MFAHEAMGLIIITIVFLLGAIAMFIHPSMHWETGSKTEA